MVKAYVMETHDLLDKRAVLNLMLWDSCQKLALAPTSMDRQMTVVDGTVAQIFGCVE